MVSAFVVALALIGGSGENTAAAVDVFDVIELNKMYDGEGQQTFAQWIFWDWDYDRSRYFVAQWKVARRGTISHDGTTWRLRFFDQGVEREVRAKLFRESWTQYDPEVEDRANTNCRRPLSPPPLLNRMLPP